MMPFTTFFSQIETMQWYGLGGLVGFPSYICYYSVLCAEPHVICQLRIPHMLGRAQLWRRLQQLC